MNMQSNMAKIRNPQMNNIWHSLGYVMSRVHRFTRYNSRNDVYLHLIVEWLSVHLDLHRPGQSRV